MTEQEQEEWNRRILAMAQYAPDDGTTFCDGPSYNKGYDDAKMDMQPVVDELEALKAEHAKQAKRIAKLRAEIRVLHLRLRDANMGKGRNLLMITDHSARMYHEAERLREENARLKKELDELNGGTT